MAQQRLKAQLLKNQIYYPSIQEARKGLIKTESNPTGRIGYIPGYPVGYIFPNRKACCKSRVHGKTIAGIHGTRDYGAYSIVLSGGYEDDQDDGDFMQVPSFFFLFLMLQLGVGLIDKMLFISLYTGTGGQVDSYSGDHKQQGDQSFEHPDNAALAKNAETGQPIRVVRGPNPDSKYAPRSGYRYDGLYKVQKAYLAQGMSGRKICQFELRRLPNQDPLPTPKLKVYRT